MKILQISDDYQRLGGTETYFFNLINLLKKKGHKVFVFAIRGKPKETKDTLVVGTPRNFLFHYFSGKIFNFRVYFELKKFIDKTKPDVIHIHNNYLAPFSVLLAVRGHKVIQTVHDYMILCPHGWMVKKNTLQVCQGNIGAKCFKNNCLSLHNLFISYLPFKLRIIATKRVVGKFISPSKKLKEYLETFGFQNAQHLPYFLTVKSFKFDAELKMYGNILYIGRLAKEKGISDLIKALPKITSEVSQAHLTIVGDGPQKKYLTSLVKKLGVTDKVNFVGKVPYEKVKEYYRKTNVVVMPSVWVDNSPNVVYEAFSAGRPVIASNRGGMSDFVKDGKTGFIFESGNVKQLAEKIIKVLKNEDLFKKLSTNCQQFSLLNFTPEKHYQRITKIYENILKVALLSFEYPPETGFGGIGTYTYNLALGLKTLGADVHVIAGAIKPKFQTSIEDGIPVTRCQIGFPYDIGFRFLSRLNLRWTSSRLRNASTMLYAFWRLNKVHQFDVIEGPECGAETFLIKRFFPKIKTMVRLHSPLYLIGHYDQITNLDLKIASKIEVSGIKNADLITALTKPFANKIIKDLSLKKDVQIIPNPVNIKEIKRNLDLHFDFRKNQSLPPNTKIVLFIGRLELRKGIDIFEKVIPQVVKELPNTIFVFIGEEHGYSKKQMIKKLKKHQAEKNALFLDRLPYEKTMNILNQADVFVLPSIYEPFGIVLVEAMVCRKPVVSTNVGGIPEVVENGKTGILVKPKDAQACSKAILELLQSPKKCVAFGKVGRKRAKKLFNHITVARRTLRVYQQLP